MEPRFLLDTDIFIYLRKQRPPGVLRRFEALQPGDAAISVISYGELIYGLAKSQFPERVRSDLAEIVNLVPVMALPPKAGEIYGELRANLQARGEMIGANDLWIAAHAKASGLTLVTNNEREFRRVPGLKIQNWVS